MTMNERNKTMYQRGDNLLRLEVSRNVANRVHLKTSSHSRRKYFRNNGGAGLPRSDFNAAMVWELCFEEKTGCFFAPSIVQHEVYSRVFITRNVGFGNRRRGERCLVREEWTPLRAANCDNPLRVSSKSGPRQRTDLLFVFTNLPILIFFTIPVRVFLDCRLMRT